MDELLCVSRRVLRFAGIGEGLEVRVARGRDRGNAIYKVQANCGMLRRTTHGPLYE